MFNLNIIDHSWIKGEVKLNLRKFTEKNDLILADWCILNTPVILNLKDVCLEYYCLYVES